MYPSFNKLISLMFIVQAGLSRADSSPPSIAPSDLSPARIPTSSSPSLSDGVLDSTESKQRFMRKKRCFYVGTFFQKIDCDAPADSTEIPYSHSHAPQSQLEQQQPTTSTRSQFPPRSHSRHTTRHSHQPTSKATTTSSKRKCMSVSVKRREKGDGKEKTVVRGSKTAGIIV
ncbi:uncharacterized protein JCM6883_000961 [Sporobolomyces salmoneus]|uniref:uncharacterized protein n=1 Tax=Sporobolomyces salmoneus TaxID=183962 RepID=UPI00318254AA